MLLTVIEIDDHHVEDRLTPQRVEVDDDAMQPMIDALDGTEMGGRALRVNEAQERRRGLSRNESFPGRRYNIPAPPPGGNRISILPAREPDCELAVLGQLFHGGEAPPQGRHRLGLKGGSRIYRSSR